MEGRAKNIKCRVLLTSGVDEGADDESMRCFLDEIKSPVRWEKFSGSSHMAHVEEKDLFVDTVARFLGQ